jgi:uncharacterized phage protein gp47/JayE
MGSLPLRNEFFRIGRRSIVLTPGQRINPQVVDLPGSDANLIVGAMAVIAEAIMVAQAACARDTFIETAVGAGLDRVVFDRYGLARFPATPATVTLVLTRPTAAFGAFTYPAGGRVQTSGGEQFATNTDAVFGALTLSVAVFATALVAGPGGNTTANTLTAFVDTPLDTTLVPNNPAGAAGGTVAETDTQFRGRVRNFFPTIRRGTIGAIEFGALQVPGVAVSSAIEIENPTGLPACMVQLVVGDRDGNASLQMLTDVKNTLVQYRAAGIPVQVTGGVPVFQPVVWHIAFTAGVDQALVIEQVRAVSAAVSQFLAPGEALYRSRLITAAQTVPGAVISDGSLVTPAGDVYPADNEHVIRIRSIDVSFSTV